MSPSDIAASEVMLALAHAMFACIIIATLVPVAFIIWRILADK